MIADGLLEDTLITDLDKEDFKKDLKLMKRDPQGHFDKLKARIKLKAYKKFEEDQVRKANEEARLAVAKDEEQFGVDGKKKKKPSKNRPPIKLEPPKVRRTFSECQMKYHGADDMFNPMKNIKQPTLTDQMIIGFMTQVNRFPIPETLLRPQTGKPFSLFIDSLINDAYRLKTVEAWADFKPALAAPENSQESEDDFFIEDSDSEEEEDDLVKIQSDQKSTRKLKPDQVLKLAASTDVVIFDMDILQTSAFRLQSVKQFPYRSKSGEIPQNLLLVPKLSYLFDCLQKIEAQQKEGLFPTELLQNVFDYYCKECDASSFKLIDLYDDEDSSSVKLSLKNFQLDDNQVKALALVLPYLHDIHEIDFNNTQMTDMCAAALALSFFMNPSLHSLTISHSFLQETFCRTLASLISMSSEKITKINLMGSVVSNDHIQPVVQQLVKMNNLSYLNIAGCTLS